MSNDFPDAITALRVLLILTLAFGVGVLLIEVF
jgi:hypothetical protein